MSVRKPSTTVDAQTLSASSEAVVVVTPRQTRRPEFFLLMFFLLVYIVIACRARYFWGAAGRGLPALQGVVAVERPVP